MSNTLMQIQIERKIFVIRDQKVMFDRDLAELYGVTTGNLNKAVKRNIDRFPADFMFRLTLDEYRSLRFQTGTLKKGAHAKYLPYVFTQEGVAMLSGVLNSKRAVEMNIQIMRAFIRLREYMSTHKQVAAKFEELEDRLKEHDENIQEILQTIQQLLESPPKRKTRIGFSS
jgi:phage regulator Rha-like protein